MSEKKENKASIVLIIMAIVLFIGTISNFAICGQYYKYRKTVLPQLVDCIDINNKEEYSSMGKVNAAKAERRNNTNVQTKIELSHETISANITISIILFLVAVLFMTSGILNMRGQEFASFLHTGKTQKIVFIIIGIFLMASGIVYGSLIAKYKEDRYNKDRELATCVKLDNLNSQSDINREFSKTINMQEREPTVSMQINTAFAIMFSLGGLILTFVGGNRIRTKRMKRVQQQPQFNVTILNPASQGTPPAPPAQDSTPPAEQPAQSKVFTPAY